MAVSWRYRGGVVLVFWLYFDGICRFFGDILVVSWR